MGPRAIDVARVINCQRSLQQIKIDTDCRRDAKYCPVARALAYFRPDGMGVGMAGLLREPKIQVMPVRRFAGPVRRYDLQSRSAIPAQWVAYNADGYRVPGAVPGDYFGVVFNLSDDMGQFDYLCGQEVPPGVALPGGFGEVSIAGRYVRFASAGHISTMNAVWAEVYGQWLTRPDYRPRPGPAVEYYPPDFDGMTGAGGFEVWVPIA